MSVETSNSTVATPSVAPSGSSNLLLIALVAGYLPMLLLHFMSLWNQPQYQYFPFIIAAVYYFASSRMKLRPDAPDNKGITRFQRTLGVVAWLILLAAILLKSPWTAALSAVIMLGAVFNWIGLRYRIQNAAGIWCLLFLLLPLPMNLDGRLITKLQRLSSMVSSGILDLVRVNHLMQGTIVTLPSRQFLVDEACSGIVSVMSVVACAAILAIYMKRSLMHAVLLIAAGLFWAVTLNIVRISAIAVAYDWWGVDLSIKTPHQVLGLVLFACTAIAVVSTDKLLMFALEPIDQVGPADAKNPIVSAWNRFVGRKEPDAEDAKRIEPVEFVSPKIFIPAFAATGLLSFIVVASGFNADVGGVTFAGQVSRETLPGEIGGYELVDFKNVHRKTANRKDFGEYSKVFSYLHQETGRQMTVSFDFPFTGGWHELSVCYKNTGWKMQSRSVNREPVDPDGDRWPIVRSQFSQDNRNGYLAFCNFTGMADSLSPPTDLVFWRPWRRLRRRLLQPFSDRVYQVQVWVEDEESMLDNDVAAIDQILIEVRETFRQLVAVGSNAE